MIGKLAPIVGSLCLIGFMTGAGLFASVRIRDALQDQGVTDIADISEVSEISERSAKQLPSPRPDVFYEAITTRPLFSPTRRPVQAVPDTVAAPKPIVAAPTPTLSEQPKIALGGVLGSTNERQALILFDDRQAQWLRVGDDVDGWEIINISDKAVILSADARTFRLEMFQ